MLAFKTLIFSLESEYIVLSIYECNQLSGYIFAYSKASVHMFFFNQLTKYALLKMH